MVKVRPGDTQSPLLRLLLVWVRMSYFTKDGGELLLDDGINKDIGAKASFSSSSAIAPPAKNDTGTEVAPGFA
jgi:hypothetical protein